MPSDAHQNQPLIDPDIFAEVSEIVGDELSELLNKYIEDADLYLSKLSAAAQAMELHTISEVTHTFGTASAHMGFMRLHTLLRSVEIMANQEEAANYPDLIASIQRCYQALLIELER